MILRIALGLMALSVVVIIHELGHFIAARLSGIEVEAFSLGWGKALIKKKIGKTEYRISLLPLGGYCKMKGEHALIEALESKEKSIPLEEGGFFTASPLKRIAVALAGPAANFIFAGLVLSIIFLVGYEEFTFGNKIILASDSANEENQWPSDLAGLETGDKIIAIDNKTVNNYKDLAEILASSARKDLEIQIERGFNKYSLTLKPQLDKNSGAGIAGIYPWIDPVIGKIEEGSLAEASGLKINDIIKEINGKVINHSIDVSNIMKLQPETMNISVEREGFTKVITIDTDFSQENFHLGIAYKYIVYKTPQLNFFQSFVKGYEEAVNTLVLSVKGLKLLFSGVNLNKAVSGPIRIINFAGKITAQGFQESVSKGFLSFFQFVSFISVALFFMNLLPIPALDGGQIVLFVFEIIKKSPLAPIFVYRYQMVGTILILVLVFLTTTSDIFVLAGK